MYFICCCSITNIVISLVAHKIHLNNQEKLTTRLNKLKVHRVNLQRTSWYLVRFTIDILITSLVSFTFFCLPVFFLFCFFGFFYFFFKLKITYSDKNSTMSDKNIFTLPISGNKTTFGLSNREATVF